MLRQDDVGEHRTPQSDPTVSQAAREVGCSLTHIYNKIKDGELEAYNLGTKMTRVRRESLDRMLAAAGAR